MNPTDIVTKNATGATPGNGTPKPDDPPNVAALKAALRAHLVAVLEKPFSLRMLLELENSARVCREFLMITKDPRQGRQAGGNYGGYGGTYVNMTPVPLGDGDGLGFDTPGGGMTANPQLGMRAETFGATLIRELVASMQDWKTPKPSAPELVSAIVKAKADKLDPEIVAGLEGQLKGLLSATTIKATQQLPAPQERADQHEHG